MLHEEILDVVASDEFSSSLQQSGGACAQVGIQICSKIERIQALTERIRIIFDSEESPDPLTSGFIWESGSGSELV